MPSAPPGGLDGRPHGSGSQVRRAWRRGGNVVDIDAEFDQDGSPGKANSSVNTRRDCKHLPAEVMLDEPAHQRLGSGLGVSGSRKSPAAMSSKHLAGDDRQRRRCREAAQGTAPRLDI